MKKALLLLLTIVCTSTLARAQQQKINFEGIPEGTIVTQVFGDGGFGPINVIGRNPECNAINPNLDAAVIFDSSCPPGGVPADCSGNDRDLGTPNRDFGGPGVDNDGDPNLGGNAGSPFQNDTAQGNLLIVHEQCNQLGGTSVANPDDTDRNSTITFEFPLPVTMFSYLIIDQEAVENANVRLFGPGDVLLATFTTPTVGDNGKAIILTDAGAPGAGTPGVVKAVFTRRGSRGLDDIVFLPPADIDIRKQAEGPDTRVFPLGTDPIPFLIVVENTGAVPLTDVEVTDDQVPGCEMFIGDLAVGQIVSYTCEASNVVDNFTNEACVEGQDAAGNMVEDCDPSTVELIDIDIRKQAEGPDARTFAPGSDVDFEIVVTNTGPSDLFNVEVTDVQVPGCAMFIGDLASGASVDYICTLPDVMAGLTNEACVEGERDGVTVEDCDPSTVVVEVCDLVIDKTCAVVPAPVDDLMCSDKIVATTLRYTGAPVAGPVTVEIDPDKGPSAIHNLSGLNAGDVLTLASENGFSVDARPDEQELGSKTFIRIDGVLTEVIHTSCSALYEAGAPAPLDGGSPAVPGNPDPNKGDPSPNWFVENFVDKDSPEVVAVPAPPTAADNCEATLGQAPSCETEDKPRTLTFEYTGGTCADTNNPQGGKFECTDVNPYGGGAVQIVITKDADKITPTPGSVGQGEQFTLARNDGKDLGGDLAMDIQQGGQVIQRLKIHASCSQRLAAGDVFGGLELVGFNGKSAGVEVLYSYEVTNLGNALTGVTVVDNPLGDIAGPLALAAGETMTFQKSVVLTETGVHTNEGIASGLLAGGQACEARDQVTVTVEEPPIPCVECGFGADDADKVSTLTLKYTGPGGLLEVYNDAKQEAKNLLFSGAVATNDLVDLAASTIGKTEFSSKVGFWVDGTNVAEIHTSCSDALGEGTTEANQAKGKNPNGTVDFEVVGGFDKAGSPLCPATPSARLFGDNLSEALEAGQLLQEAPAAFRLDGAYPNPFNPTTTIRFTLPEASQVRLVVYDVLGRQVQLLADGAYGAGTHAVQFEAGTLPSGTYLYRLDTAVGTATGTMVLSK